MSELERPPQFCTDAQQASNMLATVLFFISISPILNALADTIVALPNGSIRGRTATTFEKNTFYAFEKIPYAAPPVGDLRFKAPQPAADWTETLNTTELDVICYQVEFGFNDFGGQESEDCLYLNVYTPQLPTSTQKVALPVMFFIHGGGFVGGASQEFTPDRFVDNDVILVTILYRLGPFGFLSTQDEVIPGNYGLKDQRFALNWTHENIHLFGGDPAKIVIFGQSAGSASVGYQLLNTKNIGLVSAAIMESGSPLSPWAFQRNAREIAFKTASYLNDSFAKSDNAAELLKFLQNVDADDLDKASEKYLSDESGPQDIELLEGFYWAPVIEVKNPDAVLTRKMYGLVCAGNVVRVPLMIGMNSEETLGFNPDRSDLQSVLSAFDKNLDLVVPDDMAITDGKERTELGAQIRELYTGGEPFLDHLGDAIRYESDTAFTRSIIRHAECVSDFAETYFYQFSYHGQLPGIDIHYDGADSVSHGEELFYLFCSGDACDVSEYPESDQVTQQRLIKLWTDFAKYKRPIPKLSDLLQNVTWPILDTTDGDFQYLDIDKDLTIKNHPKEKTYEEWRKLYDSLGYDDFDTY